MPARAAPISAGLAQIDGEALALGVQLGGDAGAAFLVTTGDHDAVPALQAELGQIPSQACRAPDDHRRGSLHRAYSTA